MHHIDIISEYIKTAAEITAIFIAAFKGRDIWNWLRKKWRKAEFINIGEEFKVPEEKVECIIIPVSRIQQPEWILRHLKPKRAALLYTEITKEAALKLASIFRDAVMFVLTEEDIKNSVDIISNADDPVQTKNIVSKYIRHFLGKGIQPENIFVDTTGGKVPMSIGAFQAAEEECVSSIYVVGKGERGQINDPTRRQEGLPIFISEKK
jgi:hypothetical protein